MVDPGNDGAKGAGAPFAHPRDARLRVLLVEDDARFADLLEGAIIAVGLEPLVVGAIDDDFAIVTRRHAPAAVVVDLFLPTADALRLGRWIGGLCQVPVVVVVPGSTSPAIPEAVTERLRVVRRPVAPDVLAQTLAQIVRMRRWRLQRDREDEPDVRTA